MSHRAAKGPLQGPLSTLTPAETAHRSAGPGHLAQIAMQLGRKLKFDPVREVFLNDATAQSMLGNALRAPWTV